MSDQPEQAPAGLGDVQAWLRGQREALEAALDGAPLETSLGALVRTATDALGRGTRAAFYLSNGEGTSLHHVVGMPPPMPRRSTASRSVRSPGRAAWRRTPGGRSSPPT